MKKKKSRLFGTIILSAMILTGCRVHPDGSVSETSFTGNSSGSFPVSESTSALSSSAISEVSSLPFGVEDLHEGYYASIVSWENGEDLKRQLQALIASDIVFQPYHSNWEVNALADQSQTNFDKVEQVYSKEEILKSETNYNGKGWQKEHAFCQSLMNHYVSGKTINVALDGSTELRSIGFNDDGFVLLFEGEMVYPSALSILESGQESPSVYTFSGGNLLKDGVFFSSVAALSAAEKGNGRTDIMLLPEGGEEVNLGELVSLTFSRPEEGSKGGVASDYHNLFASFYSGNTARGNKELGTATGTITSQGDDYRADTLHFEPGDTDKGLLSRAILYMDTCYSDLRLEEGSYTMNDVLLNGYGMHGNRSELVSWASSFDVDVHEYQHNEVVFSYQKNRNPYIDFPMFVDYVYGDKRDLAGTIEDVLPSSSFLQLKMNEKNYRNLAIESVRYDYRVGETFTRADVGKAYTVYTDLSKDETDVGSLSFSLNDGYAFTEKDVGTQDVVVSDGKTSVTYSITISEEDANKDFEYIYSFIKDGKANSELLKGLSSTNPLEVSLDALDFAFSMESGARGTGNKDKGVAFGSGTAPAGTVVIESLNAIRIGELSKIKEVQINASSASGGTYLLQVYVGDVLLGEVTSGNTTARVFFFPCETPVEGKLKIVFSGLTKTLYLKEISIDLTD